MYTLSKDKIKNILCSDSIIANTALCRIFSIIHSKLLCQHRAARGTTRAARDPSGTTRLRTCPQDDIVSSEEGGTPFTSASQVLIWLSFVANIFICIFFSQQFCYLYIDKYTDLLYNKVAKQNQITFKDKRPIFIGGSYTYTYFCESDEIRQKRLLRWLAYGVYP